MHNPPGYAGIVWMQFSTYTTLRYGCFFKNGVYRIPCLQKLLIIQLNFNLHYPVCTGDGM